MPELITDPAVAARRFPELNLRPISRKTLSSPTGTDTPTCGCLIGMLILHHELPARDDSTDPFFLSTSQATRLLNKVGYDWRWLEGITSGFDQQMEQKREIDYVPARFSLPAYRRGERFGAEVARLVKELTK